MQSVAIKPEVNPLLVIFRKRLEIFEKFQWLYLRFNDTSFLLPRL